jgi:hypothetical protein
MKKKLEAELISIAHRILKLRNKSDIDQLLAETQKLYEKLSVLKFVEENFADARPTIGRGEATDIVESAFEKPSAQAPQAAEKPEAEKPEVSETDPKPEEPNPSAPSDAEPEIKTPEKDESAQPHGEKESGPESGTVQPEKEEVKLEETQSEENAEPKEKPEKDNPKDKDSEQNSSGAANEKNPEAKTESRHEAQKDAHGIAEPGKPQSDPDPSPVAETGIAFEEPESKQEAQTAKGDEFFKPAFEWAFDPKDEEKPEDKKPQQSEIAFEDLLGAGYKDPVFVKPGETPTEAPAEDNRIEPETFTRPAEPKPEVIPINRREDKVPVFKMNSAGNVSLNDRVSKGITVGLNDRIAFVKNLFNNSNEEYNRVLSQLLTFDTFAQAQDFIDNMVKPDYNNWEGKDEYAQRFMEVVEKKFS